MVCIHVPTSEINCPPKNNWKLRWRSERSATGRGMGTHDCRTMLPTWRGRPRPRTGAGTVRLSDVRREPGRCLARSTIKKMAENLIVRAEALARHYQMGQTLVRALDGLSLAIGRAEFVALLGQSGSGKSTLLN